jgi:hypothetical protein
MKMYKQYKKNLGQTYKLQNCFSKINKETIINE